MAARGVTLIELMMTVAVLGLATVIAGNAAQRQRADGLAALQRERAEQVLEYHAGCVASGRAVDPTTVGRLTESLPRATVALEPAGPATRITVSWAEPGRPPLGRTLLVFAKGGR